MKNILSGTILAFILLSLNSCKRNYVCECTSNGNTQVVADYGKVKKSDAKADCDARSNQWAQVNGSCSVKVK